MLQIEFDLSYEVKPVRVERPFEDGLAFTHCAMRPEFCFDWRTEQIASMDARNYIPAGATFSIEGDESVHVLSHYLCRGWN